MRRWEARGVWRARRRWRCANRPMPSPTKPVACRSASHAPNATKPNAPIAPSANTASRSVFQPILFSSSRIGGWLERRCRAAAEAVTTAGGQVWYSPARSRRRRRGGIFPLRRRTERVSTRLLLRNRRAAGDARRAGDPLARVRERPQPLGACNRARHCALRRELLAMLHERVLARRALRGVRRVFGAPDQHCPIARRKVRDEP